MKVFWQLGKSSVLTPTSGDMITELNSISSVMGFAQVKYGGSPSGNDIYYVRNNPRMIDRITDGKTIIFASPYDRIAYSKADYIATFTDAWTMHLKNGSTIAGLPGVKTRNAITIYQTVSSRFKPLQGHRRTRQIRNTIGGNFIIGHFGAVRKSCYPYAFLDIVREIKECYPEVRIIFGGGNMRFDGITDMNFSYKDMPYAISACDLILYNMWTEGGHIAGSMKILEAMACGVPVLSPRLEAREFELGSDYPLFYPWIKTPNGRFGETIECEMKDLIEFCINEPTELKKISNICYQRSKFYSIASSTTRLKSMFQKIVSGKKV